MIDPHLDFYDDRTGSVLKNRIPNWEDLPDFIKTAERLSPGERRKLPDDVFALVAFDGGAKLRKFACVDKGNTALSVIYFLENKDRLPVEAQKTAAANLLTACEWYDLAPPLELTKTALVGATLGALTMASGVHEGHQDYKRRKQLMAQGVPASQAFQTKQSELIGSQVMPYGRGEKTASDPAQLAWEDNWEAKRKKALGPMPSDPATKQKWVSEARAWEKKNPGSDKYLMPGTTDTPRAGVTPPWRKTASLKPYVDVSGKVPPQKVDREVGERYALIKEGQARYPIDTAAQVQKACTYFEKHAGRFLPVERHVYCSNVYRRANELGMGVPQDVAKYGSATMAKDAGVQIYRRQRMFRQSTSEYGLLQEMREKCASIRPEVMAVALEQFDRAHDLDQIWDNGLADPYFSIFGVEKVAEYSFVDGNDTVTEERLKKCAKGCKKQLKELFDEDMATEFSKDPVQIFDSLPLDSKRIIMRVAQQVEE